MEVEHDAGLTRVLFDLAGDPKERTPVPAQEAPDAAALQGSLDRWRARNAEIAQRVPRAASRELSEDEEAQLRALGYLP